MKKLKEFELLDYLVIFVGLSLVFLIFLVGYFRIQVFKGDEAAEAISWEEVTAHGSDGECYVVVDDKVFDLSKFTASHPGMFNCGTDVSENYHRNHGEGIREQMMQFYIGDLEGVVSEGKEQTKRQIAPHAEWLVDSRNFAVEELLVSIESEAGSVLVIDGETQKAIARIHDLGVKPHSIVFSPDKKWMYSIARDGFLTKLSLETFEPLKTISVGESSRGTALSNDGSILIIGNYEPQNLVYVATDTMEIVGTLDLEVYVDGELRTSRAGALVETDDDFVFVALKDLNQVWKIDLTQPRFPVVKEYTNVGIGEGEIHDGFLTPDGRYFIVAAKNTDTIWGIDVETEETFNIQAGRQPHTGPGAVYKNFAYVPHMGESSVVIINLETKTLEKTLPVGGPGLFVRSFTGDSSYPYIWGDTGFGTGEDDDEMYVINGNTNEIVQTLIPSPGDKLFHPEFGYDGSEVYVASPEAHKLFIYDAHTFELLGDIDARGPTSVFSVGVRLEEPGL